MTTVWSDCSTTCPGVLAAGLFDNEGMMVDGFASDPSFNMDHAAASFVAVVRESRLAADFLAIGPPEDVQLTYGDIVVLLRPISGSDRGLTLGLTAKREIPLGRVRMFMDFLSQRIPSTGRRPQE